MTIVLDTNAYSDFKRGSKSVVEVLESSEEIVVPTPVLGELLTRDEHFKHVPMLRLQA